MNKTDAFSNDYHYFRQLESEGKEAFIKNLDSPRSQEIDQISKDIFDRLKHNDPKLKPEERVRLGAMANRFSNWARESGKEDFFYRFADIHGWSRSTEKGSLSPDFGKNFLSKYNSLDGFQAEFKSYEDRMVIKEMLILLDMKIAENGPDRPDCENLRAQINQWVNQSLPAPSAEDLIRVVNEIQASKRGGRKPELKEELYERGFLPHIKNIDFSKSGLVQLRWDVTKGSELFRNVNFDGITFESCNLQWVQFNQSSFRDCRLIDCKMNNSVFNKAILQNTRFQRCDLQRGMFENARLNDCALMFCNLSHNNFNEASLNKVNISSCRLKGAAFLNANVQNSRVANSETKDGLFFGTEAEFQIKKEKPEHSRVALTWDPDHPGATGKKVETSLIRSDALPMKVNYHPDRIEIMALSREAHEALLNIDTKDPHFFSIPHSFIQEVKANRAKYPEIVKMLEIAEQMTDSVECIVLPGGENVPPEFYRKPGEMALSPQDYRRTILEFALIEEGVKKGLPIMGICRGCQMIGVYFGVPLKDVPGQMGEVMKFRSTQTKERTGKGTVRGVLGKAQRGYSYHYQALDKEKVPDRLEIVLETKGVPKALEGTEGAPVLAFQYHPEIKGDPTELHERVADKLFLNKANLEIFEEFAKSGQAIMKRREKITPQALEEAKFKLRPPS